MVSKKRRLDCGNGAAAAESAAAWRVNIRLQEEKLGRLKQAGSISDAEFSRLRARLVQ